MMQIKFGSVKLAKKYMKRVAMELQSKTGMEKDPAMDYMLLQGVRFAFRIHQVCCINNFLVLVSVYFYMLSTFFTLDIYLLYNIK